MQQEVSDMGVEKILDQAPDGWVTSDEIAAQLGLSRSHANQKATRGHLEAVKVSAPGTKIGWRWMFRPQATTVTKPAVQGKVIQMPAPPQQSPINLGDDLVRSLMAARGLSWGDVAAHLGLGVSHEELVGRWVAQNGASALGRALVEAVPGAAGGAAAEARITELEDKLNQQQGRYAILLAERKDLQREYDELVARRAGAEQQSPAARFVVKDDALSRRVQELAADVDERNDQLSRQLEKIRSLELQIETLRKRGLLVDELQERQTVLQAEIAELTLARDSHAKAAADATRKLADIELAGKKLGVQLGAQREESEKYKAAAEFYEQECVRLRAALDGKRIQGAGSDPVATGEPVAVSGVVFASLRVILDPKKHVSGSRFWVGPPYDRREVVKQMRRTGESHHAAIRWLEDNPDLYDLGLENGFCSPNGAWFKPGQD